jgi:outer membrane protein assembly factor BamB
MTTRRPNNDTVISYDEILVRKYASAPIEWVDEQLRARHLDHARVICAVLAMREQHERCNEARRKRRTVARAVAAAIAIGMLLLATNDERHSGHVPLRSAVGAQRPLAMNSERRLSIVRPPSAVDARPPIATDSQRRLTLVRPHSAVHAQPPIAANSERRSGSVPPRSAVGAQPPLALVKVPESGWPTYRGNLERTGRPLGRSSITNVTVPEMTLAWRTQLKGPVVSAPSVLRNRLYIGDWSGTESSIDVQSGEVVATANLGQTHAPQCDPKTLGITSSAAVVNGLIYLAGGDDGFYALDAETLRVVWRTSLGDNSASGGYYGWSSPAVIDNRVFQGVASNCDNPFVKGRLVALDPVTGKEVASANFSGEGGVGNGVWRSPTVDLQTHKIFITTGSGPDFFDGAGYSIIRLDLDSLVIEDLWKVADYSTWDSDWGSSPVLFSDKSGKLLVGAGHKDGHYYAFDRSNLAAGPVWTAEIASHVEIPQGGDGTLSTGAFDGTRLYVGGGRPPDATNPEANGSVVALDPTNGAILWRHTFAGPVIAPVSTINGVVFAAAGNLVTALDAVSGNVLWSYCTDSVIYGGIAIAGDSIFVGDLSGKLYAFRIPSHPERSPIFPRVPLRSRGATYTIASDGIAGAMSEALAATAIAPSSLPSVAPASAPMK